jgi:hypothetical protein
VPSNWTNEVEVEGNDIINTILDDVEDRVHQMLENESDDGDSDEEEYG